MPPTPRLLLEHRDYTFLGSHPSPPAPGLTPPAWRLVLLLLLLLCRTRMKYIVPDHKQTAARNRQRTARAELALRQARSARGNRESRAREAEAAHRRRMQQITDRRDRGIYCTMPEMTYARKFLEKARGLQEVRYTGL